METEDRAKRLAWVEEFQTQAAVKIREDSKNLGKPTRITSLAALARYLKPQEIQTGLTEIVGNKEYRDIKSVVAKSGTAYFFSETFLPEDRAKRLAGIDEFHLKAVEKVRGDSKYQAKLTKADSLATLAPELTPEEIQAGLAEITKDAQCPDIKSIITRSGAAYFFGSLGVAVILDISGHAPCDFAAK